MKFAFTQNPMSHQCICDNTTTTLCVQTVGTCHTCQEISAKDVIWICMTHFLGTTSGFWCI